MEDTRIVDLYWERSETAIFETQKKYGHYCHSIAYNILFSDQDAEECVNDTYIRTWNALPPHRPERLSAFLAKITRRLALDRYGYAHAQKRAGQTQVVIEEMESCLPDLHTGDAIADELALRQAINEFLRLLPKQTRILFLRRYWYFSDIREIALEYGLSESNVKVTLYRTRNKFREFLEKEGITV